MDYDLLFIEAGKVPIRIDDGSYEIGLMLSAVFGLMAPNRSPSDQTQQTVDVLQHVYRRTGQRRVEDRPTGGGTIDRARAADMVDAAGEKDAMRARDDV